MGLFGKKGPSGTNTRDGSTQKMQVDPQLVYESALAMLAQKRWDEAINTLEQLALKYPDRRADCEAKIAEATKGKAAG
jgi:outer membrane protein assembly factor BamD (BamD/ComL family)